MTKALKRTLTSTLQQDLKEKMVLLAGPRQVGKTTLARSLGVGADYLNWDIDEDRQRILRKEFRSESFIIFDEIHKFKTWRNYLKGIVDSNPRGRKILVTGSARLDLFRKGGDSLQGRYHFLRLHPLTVKELGISDQAGIEKLFRLSGFPEPYFSFKKVAADRWTRGYAQRLIHQEVRSIEAIEDLGKLELLMLRLPDLVGSPLSINALREDLQIAHKTASRWLDALERLYAFFRISPFGPAKIKAVKKEQKLYFFDWNQLILEGPRFENFMAVHLLKWVQFLQDAEGRQVDLRYFRTVDHKEVDFVITERGKPVYLIECKLRDDAISPHLIYLSKKYPQAKAIQVTLMSERPTSFTSGVERVSAVDFLTRFV